MRDGGFSFRAPDALQHRLWLIWLSDLLYAILFVWVYVRGREHTPWLGQGFRYWCADDAFYNRAKRVERLRHLHLPHMLVVKWMAAGGVVLVILGLLVAAICQNQKGTA